MDIVTEPMIYRDRSDESLSDDSNLSSASLLRTLIEQSDNDLSFRNMSIEEKIIQIPHQVKGSYFEERESGRYRDSYNKDIEEHMLRTERDRRKSFKDFSIPKYSSDDFPNLLKRSYSRPDLSELRIPLMTQFSKLSLVRKSSHSNSTYVGKLLSTYATGPSTKPRPRRISTIRLDKYKQKIKEEEGEVPPVRATSANLNDDYTTQEKKMIDEVLGDIPYRKESVYVPYGKLSYLRGLPNAEEEEPTNLFAPSTEFLKLPSYDESLLPSKDTYQARSIMSNEQKPMKDRSSMWDRTPSVYEFTLDPGVRNLSTFSEVRKSSTEHIKKSVRFSQ